MFDKMKGMGDLMKLMGQAGKIKENMAQAQTRAKSRTAVGESGAGMVKVTVNGLGDVLAVQIDPEAIKEPDTLGPLVAAAVNAALAKGKEVMLEETQSALGGIDLPPGMI